MIERKILVLRAASPISHGDTHTGLRNSTNARLFMRQGVLRNGIAVPTPHISENALRSIIFRRTSADILVDALNIKSGELNQAIVNLLYSGGSMGGEKASGNEGDLGHKIRMAYPSLELLGGAVNSFILPTGRLRMTAWIVAREYAYALESVIPERTDLIDEARSISAHDLMTPEVRTRGIGAESEKNQMIYEYETFAAGGRIVVEITLCSHTRPVTASALDAAFNRWDGYFGGQARQGRGRLIVDSHNLSDGQEYLEFLAENKSSMRNGLIDGTLCTGKCVCHE